MQITIVKVIKYMFVTADVYLMHMATCMHVTITCISFQDMATTGLASFPLTKRRGSP